MSASHKQHIVFLFILVGILFFVRDTTDAPSPAASRQALPRVQAVGTYPTPLPGKYTYADITESCGPDFEGRPCILAYEELGAEQPVVTKLRNGMVLRIKDTVEKDGMLWHHVIFDEWLRYPGRVPEDWYIPAFAGRIVKDDGVETVSSTTPKTSKRIIVDLSDHTIYAYDGDRNFLTTKVATGVEFAPTPLGTFTIYKKTPSRYMQGPLPGVNDSPFDLPGVPWNMYFTEGGAVIHGSYWHDRYGTEQSSGCVNLPPELAKILYDWAPLGTTVTIRN